MSRPAVLDRVETAGGVVFTRGDLNLNIIGERIGLAPDAFDDLIHVVFKRHGQWVHRALHATTDPGLYWLKNPMRVEGAAILTAGQHRGLFKIGLHRRKYKALVQARPVAVWRDDDMDNVFDFSKVHVGMFGINLHRASYKGPSGNVHKWSAGCQVVQDPDDFEWLMSVVEESAALYGDTFTYTLLHKGVF